jgi:hypothetical protein
MYTIDKRKIICLINIPFTGWKPTASMKINILQLIGILVGIVAIIAAYNIFFLGRPLKALQIVIDTASPLVNIRPEASGTIQILYNGQAVTNPELLQIEIRNSGNQPILVSDYSRPLLFSFNPQDEIINVAIINSKPSNINLIISKASTDGYEASAIPTLLNPADVVTARFIVAEVGSDPILSHFHIDGRIAGVKEIALISQSDQQQPTSLQIVLNNIAVSSIAAISTLILAYFFENYAQRKHRKLIRERNSISRKFRPRSR